MRNLKLFIAMGLTGCGGVGWEDVEGASGALRAAGVAPPVADAGTDSTAAVSSSATLDASGSSDPDGDPLSYRWKFVGVPSGSSVWSGTIDDRNAEITSFVADSAGVYTASVKVSDGLSSDRDEVDIDAYIPGNTAPVADAGADVGATLGDDANLDCSASSDADGDALLHRWKVLYVPVDSTIISNDIDDRDADVTFFTPDVVGEYALVCTVTDGDLEDEDTVLVAVAYNSASNTAPVADAGGDQSDFVGSTIALDGTGSSDPDGDPLDYIWKFNSVPSGSALVSSDITGRFSSSASFVPDVDGIYEARIKADDGVDAGYDVATITVWRTVNNDPVVSASVDDSLVYETSVVTATATATDADGDPLTYAWTFVSVPGTSSLTDSDISDAATDVATFQPDTEGTFEIEVAVNDGYTTVTDSASVVSVSVGGNTAPVANAGANQSVSLGDAVAVDGSGSYDPDGDPVTYRWKFLNVPAGSAQVSDDLANRDSQITTWTPDAEGTYVLEIAVDDGLDEVSDTVNVSVGPADTGIVDTGDTADTGTAPGGLSWTESTSYVLEPTTGHYTASWGISAPTVIWDDNNSEYLMFFENQMSSLPDVDCKSGYQLGRATSPDAINWTLDSSPALTPASGTYYECVLSQPGLVFDGTTYHLFFGATQTQTACAGLDTAADSADTGASAPAWGCEVQTGIGYATSTDGSTWTVSSEPIVNRKNVGHPTAVIMGSTIFLYIADAPGQDIDLYTSDDGGSTWTSDGAVIDSNTETWMGSKVTKPSALCMEGNDKPQELFLCATGTCGAGSNEVSHAKSTYGTSWTVAESDLTTAWAHWDMLATTDGSYLAWYSEKDTDNVRKVGLAWTNPLWSQGVNRSCSAPPAPVDTGSDTSTP